MEKNTQKLNTTFFVSDLQLLTHLNKGASQTSLSHWLVNRLLWPLLLPLELKLLLLHPSVVYPRLVPPLFLSEVSPSLLPLEVNLPLLSLVNQRIPLEVLSLANQRLPLEVSLPLLSLVSLPLISPASLLLVSPASQPQVSQLPDSPLSSQTPLLQPLTIPPR